MGALLYAFPPEAPFRVGQMHNRLAISTATAVIAGSAFDTLDEQQVTGLITAIGMRIGRAAALVTDRYNLAGYPLSHAIIKDEILAPELVDQPLFPDRIRIVNDPAFEMIDIRKPLMQQPGAGLFTPDATGAVHNYRAAFFIL